MAIMLQHNHIAAQSCQSYQVSESMINVGLHIRPLSVKSKDPGSLGKDSLFYWEKIAFTHITGYTYDIN